MLATASMIWNQACHPGQAARRREYENNQLKQANEAAERTRSNCVTGRDLVERRQCPGDRETARRESRGRGTTALAATNAQAAARHHAIQQQAESSWPPARKTRCCASASTNRAEVESRDPARGPNSAIEAICANDGAGEAAPKPAMALPPAAARRRAADAAERISCAAIAASRARQQGGVNRKPCSLA